MAWWRTTVICASPDPHDAGGAGEGPQNVQPLPFIFSRRRDNIFVMADPVAGSLFTENRETFLPWPLGSRVHSIWKALAQARRFLHF